LISCENVPLNIVTVISAKLATMHELQTVYGTRDLFDMIEMIVVDRYNTRKLSEIRP
jgi:hypothetical protein